jgi:hypothetical protein
MRSCLRTPTVLLPISLGHHRESKGEGETGKISWVEVVLQEMERNLNEVVLSRGKQRYIQIYRRHGGPYPL